MTLHVLIRLDGPPRGKGRPRASSRGGFIRMHTDEKTVKYETQVRHVARLEMAGRPPTMLPVELTMTVRFAVPTAWSRKKTAAALAGEIRPTVKPDLDNSLKLCDALNGIVWGDDKQVVDARVRKLYAETPGLLIEITTLPAPAIIRSHEVGPLFDVPYDPAADARGCYGEAIRAIGERVKAGAPVPEFMRSEKES